MNERTRKTSRTCLTTSLFYQVIFYRLFTPTKRDWTAYFFFYHFIWKWNYKSIWKSKNKKTLDWIHFLEFHFFDWQSSFDGSDLEKKKKKKGWSLWSNLMTHWNHVLLAFENKRNMCKLLSESESILKAWIQARYVGRDCYWLSKLLFKCFFGKVMDQLALAYRNTCTMCASCSRGKKSMHTVTYSMQLSYSWASLEGTHCLYSTVLSLVSIRAF